MPAVKSENPHILRILQRHQAALGKHAGKYRNHVLRVYHISLALYPQANEHDRTKLAIAAAFHDIGIWTHHTFDYLKPSMELARLYLAEEGLSHYADEVSLIIDNHHKLTPYRNNILVENFRRADLTDLSLNLFRFGVPRKTLRVLNNRYPYQGFHRFIFGQIAKNIRLHPLRPLPIVKR